MIQVYEDLLFILWFITILDNDRIVVCLNDWSPKLSVLREGRSIHHYTINNPILDRVSEVVSSKPYVLNEIKLGRSFLYCFNQNELSRARLSVLKNEPPPVVNVSSLGRSIQ